MGNTVTKIRDLCKEGRLESTTRQRPNDEEDGQTSFSFEQRGKLYQDSEWPGTTQEMENLIKIDYVPRQHSSTVSEGFKKTNKVFPVVFKWRNGGDHVQIGGTFNKWKTIPMVESAQEFAVVVHLPEGEHQFKFFVNGEWKHDPSVSTVDDGSGAVNNLIEVKEEDFDVFQAQAMDSFSVPEGQSHHAQSEDYSQDRPLATVSDKSQDPSIIPPHLEHSSMNAEQPSHRGPDLPEPHHVTLNHPHTSIIGDGILEVSTTRRFREKYVTTVLYQPIE